MFHEGFDLRAIRAVIEQLFPRFAWEDYTLRAGRIRIEDDTTLRDTLAAHKRNKGMFTIVVGATRDSSSTILHCSICLCGLEVPSCPS